MFSLLRVFEVNFTCRIKYKQGNQLLMPGVDKLVDELYPLKYITGINQHFRIINKSFRIAGNKNDFSGRRHCGNAAIARHCSWAPARADP